ncbi:pentapeptide repeat-containing protein [Pseudanabaena galeata UHCC 0370]|uniref:Pentapeptide repeat-containing protein n=1 Tax=Pseudanabaena galeata UHCC 0370 TaxID=3110310 RepID=A0ABU5TT86_9CYAN|nr:pentapeptide repeat-containing protein [Pseudanabaena galeata]MEA5480688.1 pentapeptide repeat-containing protein [Pseudanabaena galeata UHCC 0370]
MIYLEHFNKLNEGVESWNKWRSDNPHIRPILLDVDLSLRNLNGINFSNASLERAELMGTQLIQANLSGAKLRNAKLCGVVHFHPTDTINTQRYQTCNLSDADLTDADLTNANLTDAKLSNACLVKANLFSAKMYRANLRESNLHQADLTEANLFKADLSKANLEQSKLIRLQAVETNFTEARLTGACIKDWNISQANLNNVDCQYVYLNSFNKDRCPIDQEFTSGEFTKRFQISQNILEVVFRNGVPWQSFAYAFHEVNLRVLDEYGDELFLQEYKVLGDGLVVLKISYPYYANGTQIQEELQKKTNQLEHQISSLEGEIKAKDETLLIMERILSTRKSEASNNEPRRIHIDGIDSFEKVKNIDRNSISHLLRNGRFEIKEDEIQIGLEKILCEEFHKKDWGGEYNDLYTSNLIFQGERKSAAFLLKGKGERSPTMEIKHCGKNGDQLVRLLESPAELFFVQFVGNISESVIKDIDSKIKLHRYEGQQSYYCVIDGLDTARLMYAYGLIEN